MQTSLGEGALVTSCPTHFIPMERVSSSYLIGGWVNAKSVQTIWGGKRLLHLPGIKPRVPGHLAHTLDAPPTVLSHLQQNIFSSINFTRF